MSECSQSYSTSFNMQNITRLLITSYFLQVKQFKWKLCFLWKGRKNATNHLTQNGGTDSVVYLEFQEISYHRSFYKCPFVLMSLSIEYNMYNISTKYVLSFA